MTQARSEAPRFRDLSLNERWLLAAILLFGAVLRIAWNDVALYSPADESVYAGYTKTLADGGFVHAYPEIVRAYQQEQRRWVYPSPLRWGYFALSTAAAAIERNAEPRALAWLSTISGILVVGVVFLLALHLFGSRVALMASAFTSVSSIELALGRRALQDEVFCLSVTMTLYLLIRVFTQPPGMDSRMWAALAIAGMTLSFAIKESSFFVYPAFVALLLVYRTPRQLRMGDLMLFLLPPFLNFALFSLLARSATAFFRLGTIVSSSMNASYVLQYQSGPPHRVLLDFITVAPLVTVVAAAAIVWIVLTAHRRSNASAFAVFVVVGVAVFSVMPMKNLRFYVILDPMIRILAAWLFASGAVAGRSIRVSGLALIAAANAAIELEIFRTIFIVHEVYDPVTQNLLQALSAVPGGAGPAVRMLFPAICVALIVLWWMLPRPHALDRRRDLQSHSV